MLNDLVDDVEVLKASALSYAKDMLLCSYKVVHGGGLLVFVFRYQPTCSSGWRPSYYPMIMMQGLQLTKEQLNAAADGMSLRATVTAENSHQILLVNDPVAAAQGTAWLNSIASKSGKIRPKL